MRALQASAAATARFEGGLCSSCGCGARGRGDCGLCPSRGCGAVGEGRTAYIRCVTSTFGRLQLCQRGRSHPTTPSHLPQRQGGGTPSAPPFRAGPPSRAHYCHASSFTIADDGYHKKYKQPRMLIPATAACFYRGAMSRAPKKLSRATDCCLLLLWAPHVGTCLHMGQTDEHTPCSACCTAGSFNSNSYCGHFR